MAYFQQLARFTASLPAMFDQPMLIAHKYVPQDKFDDHRVYVQQQHTVQIIQLVEAPAPPQRNLGSAIDSSYCSSSSYSESSSLASEEEEEVVCESYCSSDDEEVQDTRSCPPDTYSLRMKRILSWRENFSAHLSATLSGGYFLTSNFFLQSKLTWTM